LGLGLALGLGLGLALGLGLGLALGFGQGQGQELPPFPVLGDPPKYPPIISFKFILAYAFKAKFDKPGVERIKVNDKNRYKKLLYFLIYYYTSIKLVISL
jgi:hypothetical protein